jgi:hypothetical protein
MTDIDSSDSEVGADSDPSPGVASPPASRGIPAHRRGLELRGAAKRAAALATERVNQFELPLVGSLPLPPPDQLAFLGGITTLVLIGVLDWPIGVLLGAGHLLAADRNNRLISAFGAALEETA